MTKILLFFFFAFYSQILVAQSGASVIKKIGDTLFFSDRKIIFPGQILVAGQGSSDNGWYKDIGYKNFFALPLLINREGDLQYSYNGRSNPEQERENDLVKATIHQGDLLLVKRIKRITQSHNLVWYKAILVPKKFPRTKFYCNLEKAVNSHEVFIL